jgi:hypothetical protein
MKIDHQKNHLKTVVRKLAKIDILQIQRLKEAKPISDKMYAFCCSIFDLYSYDTSIVYDIYKQERDYFNLINDFDGIENSNYDNLKFCLNIIKSISDITFGTVYYLCQGISNDKYPMYKVEDIGIKVINDFCDVMKIPHFVISELANSDSSEKRSDIWRLLFSNPNYPWCQDNDLEYSKDFNSKIQKLEYKNSYLEKYLPPQPTKDRKVSHSANKNLEYMKTFMKEANTLTSRKASNYQQITYLIVNELNKHAVYNHDDLDFTGLNHSGFSALLSSELKLRDETIHAISSNISDIIINTKIKDILEMFPELGINGSLFETKPFYKLHCPNSFKQEDGTVTTEALFRGQPIIMNTTITVCPYATWNDEYNELLIKLFNHLKIDIALLSYSESKTPIIQL